MTSVTNVNLRIDNDVNSILTAKYKTKPQNEYIKLSNSKVTTRADELCGLN